MSALPALPGRHQQAPGGHLGAVDVPGVGAEAMPVISVEIVPCGVARAAQSGVYVVVYAPSHSGAARVHGGAVERARLPPWVQVARARLRLACGRARGRAGWRMRAAGACRDHYLTYSVISGNQVSSRKELSREIGGQSVQTG